MSVSYHSLNFSGRVINQIVVKVFMASLPLIVSALSWSPELPDLIFFNFSSSLKLYCGFFPYFLTICNKSTSTLYLKYIKDLIFLTRNFWSPVLNVRGFDPEGTYFFIIHGRSVFLTIVLTGNSK